MIVCAFLGLNVVVIFVSCLDILRFASVRFVLNCGEHTIPIYLRRVIPAYGAFSAAVTHRSRENRVRKNGVV